MSNNPHAGGSAIHCRTHTDRPMRDLLTQLRQVQPEVAVGGAEALAYELNDLLAERAETVMAVCQSGMAAVGQLMAHASPVIEDGTVSADSVEALGWLIAELGDLSGYCFVLASECRRAKFITPDLCNPRVAVNGDSEPLTQFSRG